jgi:integrase
VWSAHDRKTIRKTFPSLAEARAWRQETQVAVRKGTVRPTVRISLGDAAAAWLEGARAGVIRTRSGDPYKPSAIRAYHQSLKQLILPALGRQPLTAITRAMLQEFVDRLVGDGLPASTVSNTIIPLRAIYRRAEQRDEVANNPTLRLSLPAVRPQRERIASPVEARALLEALPERERCLWATALYAGLRLGELQALDWSQVDLERRLIRITRSWDAYVGLISPKSRSGVRNVPVPETLMHELRRHHDRQGRPEQGFVFPNHYASAPFYPDTARARARAAWAAVGLSPIQLHECRHTYASYLIAAGVNTKALSTYMGHASITVTLDRYGHLLPGHDAEAAELLESWLKLH